VFTAKIFTALSNAENIVLVLAFVNRCTLHRSAIEKSTIEFFIILPFVV